MITQFHSKSLSTVVLFIILAGLLAFNGCVKPDEETIAKVDELKAELARVRQLLDEAGSQRDALTLKLETLSKSMAEIQAHIQMPVQGSTDITAVKAQLSEVTAQRDAAMAETKQTRAMIEQLRNQLQQQIKKTAELQTQIENLQESLVPPTEEPVVAAEEEKPEPDSPVVGFPEAPGFED
ncbi:MAG: hypothetical protein ACYTEU_07195 [Planctomycetota bacterium]|jgi:septal ring factor EnvC (AmiA/AmiB activator)